MAQGTASVSLTSYTLVWNGSYDSGTNIIYLDYSSLDFTPSVSDIYKSTSGDIFKVYINGVRIYRQSDNDYDSGEGFLEPADKASGVTWTNTSDTVWTVNTVNSRVELNRDAIRATTLYHPTGGGSRLLDSDSDVAFTTDSIIELRRSVQDESTPAIDYSNASILTEQDLDNASKNVFHMGQQAIIQAEKGLLYDTGAGVYSAFEPGGSTAKRISNLATPTGDTDATTKAYVDVSTNVPTVAAIASDVTTVAGIASNVTAVAGDATDIGAVAAKATEIGRLGTADAVADLAILGTSAIVADLDILATSAIVEDLSILGTSDVVSDLNTLGTSDVVSDMNTLAAISGNITTVAGISANTTTVAGISGNVTTVAGISGNTTTVAGISSNVTTVAGISSDVTSVASKATEIGRLGTTDAVADMALLGTTACVADMAILGTTEAVADMAILATTDIVADMAILGTTDVVADMAILGTSDVVSDLNTLGTADVVSDLNTLGTADVVSDMNTLGTSGNVTNMNTLAGISANITTVAGVSANVTTVATNIADVNNFADTYFGSDSTSDGPSGTFTEGDLYFSTYNSGSGAENKLKVRNSSNAWQNATTSVEGVLAIDEDNTGNGSTQYYAFTHDCGLEMVFLNGVRMIPETDYKRTSANNNTTHIADGGTANFIYFVTAPALSDNISLMAFGNIESSVIVPKSGGTFTGNVTIPNLTVTGTTTTIDTATLTVDDKNIELGSVATPTDTTADGGGITLKGATDKTIIWDDAQDNWTTNQDWNLATGKVIKENNTSILSRTALGSTVLASSLTSVGTLTGLTLSGASQFNHQLTVGADTDGHDVKFFGNTSGKSFLWDESDDVLRITGKSDGSKLLEITDGTSALFTVRNTELVINEESRDTDFRVESDGDTHALFVEGSSGNVGIGITAPATTLHVVGNLWVNAGYSNDPMDGTPSSDDACSLIGSGGYWGLRTDTDTKGFNLDVYNGGSPISAFHVAQGGNVGIGTTNPSDYHTAASNLVVYGSSHTGVTIATGGANSTSLYFADGTGTSDENRGSVTYDHGNNSMIFGTDTVGRMTINSSGNVGIGDTSPGAKLSIKTTSSTFSQPLIYAEQAGNGMGAHFKNIIGAGADNPVVHIETTDGGFDQPNLKITQDGGGDSILIANNGNGNAMNIDHNGDGTCFYIDNVGTGASVHLNHKGTHRGLQIDCAPGSASTAEIAQFSANNSNVDGNLVRIHAENVQDEQKMLVLDVGSGNTIQFSVDEDGDVTYSGTHPSDERLKENISDAEYGLSEILQLQPRKFNLKNVNSQTSEITSGDATKIKHGFIAQECQNIIPDMCKGDPNSEKPSMKFDYLGMCAVLTKAVQELSAKITVLENA